MRRVAGYPFNIRRRKSTTILISNFEILSGISKSPKARCAYFAASCFFASSGWGAVLFIDSERTDVHESSVRVPVSLEVSREERVAAIQVDLVFDDSRLQFITLSKGKAAVDAEKEVHAHSLSPGKVRLLVAGLNLRVIPSGDIAVCDFIVKDRQFQEDIPIQLKNVLMADPGGARVTSRSLDGAVIFDQQSDQYEAIAQDINQTTGGCIGSCRKEGDQGIDLASVLGDVAVVGLLVARVKKFL